MNNYDNKYLQRGASAAKSEVHAAIKNIDKGIFPGAFCKVTEDFFGNDPDFCNIMHADGAGTKSSLAYIYYKETGDIDIFKGLAQDSLIMNIDDLLATGATGGFLFSNTIGRNKKLISGEIIAKIIEGYEETADLLNSYGISIKSCGGETADVGDLVRTLIVDSTATVRLPRNQIIDNDRIQPGDVIVGLASYGQSTYEKVYNSGMGSNGLTSARHDIFSNEYLVKYPESCDPNTDSSYLYSGKFRLTDNFPVGGLNISQAVLSPTRTYAPLIKVILDEMRDDIHGMIHCSGGGQVKCRSFGKNICYVKDHLLPIPPLFEIIRETTQTSYAEMMQVFNMGCRMEIILPEDRASAILNLADKMKITAAITGHIEKNNSDNNTNKVFITGPDGSILEY